MQLPAHLMLEGLRVAGQFAECQHASQQKLIHVQLEARLHELALEHERVRLEAHQQMLGMVISAIQHARDRRLDLLKHAFDRYTDYINQRREALHAEKRALPQRRRECAGKHDHLALDEAERHLRLELISLDCDLQLVTLEFMALVDASDVSFSLPSPRLLPSS